MIVSIARELGAGGRTVGEAVAAALGAPLLDERSFIELLAHRSGLPARFVADRIERPPTAGERLAADLAAATAMLPIPALHSSDDRTLVDTVREVILESARAGHVVVIGHGGRSTLGWRPPAVRLFAMLLRAGRSWRIDQLAHRYGIGRDEALRRIERTDDARARYQKHYFESLGLERAITVAVDLSAALAHGEPRVGAT